MNAVIVINQVMNCELNLNMSIAIKTKTRKNTLMMARHVAWNLTDKTVVQWGQSKTSALLVVHVLKLLQPTCSLLWITWDNVGHVHSCYAYLSSSVHFSWVVVHAFFTFGLLIVLYCDSGSSSLANFV